MTRMQLSSWQDVIVDGNYVGMFERCESGRLGLKTSVDGIVGREGGEQPFDRHGSPHLAVPAGDDDTERSPTEFVPMP